MSENVTGGGQVPVLDVGRLTRASSAAAASSADCTTVIRDAAVSHGYLLLDGVFRGNTILAELLARMRGFFALPDDDPRKRAIDVSGRTLKYGWMPLYGEPAYQPGTRARVESFDCGRPRRAGDDPAGGSRWPDLPGFRDGTRAAWHTLTAAGFALLEQLSLAAGFERPFLRARCDSQELSTMRLLHYPGQREAPAPGDVGIAAHTDFECITLLYQTTPGLQLRCPSGDWQQAPAGDGQLIVLFGDMLETWSGGRFRATPHRVPVTRDERYSVVLFFAVNDGVRVAPPAGHASRYPVLTQRQHSARALALAERNRDAAQRA